MKDDNINIAIQFTYFKEKKKLFFKKLFCCKKYESKNSARYNNIFFCNPQREFLMPMNAAYPLSPTSFERF